MNAKTIKKIRQGQRRVLREMYRNKPWYVPRFIWNIFYRGIF